VTAATGGNVAYGAMAGDAARQVSSAMLNGRFDWKDFAKRTAVGATLGPVTGDIYMGKDPDHPPGFTETEYDWKSTAIAGASAFAGQLVGGGPIVQRAVSNIVSQQLNRAAGRQQGFSWEALVASAIGLPRSRDDLLSLAANYAMTGEIGIGPGFRPGSEAAVSSATPYNDGDIARSELRWSSEPPPSFPDYSGLGSGTDFGGYVPPSYGPDMQVADASGRYPGPWRDSTLNGAPIQTRETGPRMWEERAMPEEPQRVVITGHRLSSSSGAQMRMDLAQDTFRSAEIRQMNDLAAVEAQSAYLSAEFPSSLTPAWRSMAMDNLASILTRPIAPAGGSPGAYLSASDLVAESSAMEARQRSANNIAMFGAGFPFVGASMAIARAAKVNEAGVAQTGVQAAAFLDLYAPRAGGVRALASPPRGRVGLVPNPTLERDLVLRGDAARAQIVGAIGEAAQPSIQALLRLDPSAKVGFRGSLASGLKGEHKLDINGNRVAFDGKVAFKLNTKTGVYEPYRGRQGYDADFFVVSDKLAERLGNGKRFMDATRLDPSLQPVFDSFGGAMQSNPLLTGMKHGSTSFRVWSQEAMERKIQRGDAPYFFLPESESPR